MAKLTMFCLFVFLIVSVAGNVVSGSVAYASTALTDAVDASDTTIYVSDTTGFPDTGIIQIEDEQIAYSSITSTSFHGSFAQPLLRGANGTTASSHPTTAIVRTQEAAMFNTTASYDIATLSDSSGVEAFIAVPIAFFQLIGSFLFLPLQFLGTDLAVLTYVWMIVGIGFLVTLTVSLAGGRHV